MVELTTKSDEFKPTNPEAEETKDEKEVLKLIHGMRELDFKNTVVDLQSKKQTWESLCVPLEIREGLAEMFYDKPSII